MKILIAGLGTRGDIYPLLAYAQHLQNRGHEAVFCGTLEWQSICDEMNIPCHLFPISFDALAQKNSSVMGRPIRALRLFIQNLRQLTSIQFPEIVKLIENCDGVLAGGIEFAAFSPAEKYSKAYVHILHCPNWLESLEVNPPIFSKAFRGGSFIKRIRWIIFKFILNRAARKMINQQRMEIGLAPVEDIYSLLREKVVITQDRELCYYPADLEAPRHMAYLSLPSTEGLSLELARFIEKGRCLYIGFGSMPLKKDKYLLWLISLCRSISYNVVVSAPGNQLRDSDDQGVFWLQDSPHPLIFPRMSLLIHHGGAGTIYNAALSGVPQIIIPHLLDQFYWAERMNQLGVSPRSVSLAGINKGRIKKRLLEVLNNPSYADRAKELAKKIQRNNDFSTLDSFFAIE
ncbi:MAG: glycosyltransferase [Spirochaetaceae bacterium]|jgi:UDP:flavonoid glycosyltransferase YjiC (YdhE family)|nr:glycosyltransferase [Spirochaetaceae bacterium]